MTCTCTCTCSQADGGQAGCAVLAAAGTACKQVQASWLLRLLQTTGPKSVKHATHDVRQWRRYILPQRAGLQVPAAYQGCKAASLPFHPVRNPLPFQQQLLSLVSILQAQHTLRCQPAAAASACTATGACRAAARRGAHTAATSSNGSSSRQVALRAESLALLTAYGLLLQRACLTLRQGLPSAAAAAATACCCSARCGCCLGFQERRPRPCA
jgi:hypothetical protein